MHDSKHTFATPTHRWSPGPRSRFLAPQSAIRSLHPSLPPAYARSQTVRPHSQECDAPLAHLDSHPFLPLPASSPCAANSAAATASLIVGNVDCMGLEFLNRMPQILFAFPPRKDPSSPTLPGKPLRP
ncbi:hypothetical protein BV22DRAFT_309073 [Leucogyrophana mollusca]|uniref:Uncharacterized protein n=1 Tax=Leucogyrophana mollusca TaxID=85980 RepID=A0ACB8BPD7_9AGAM|nr:hypothetical protein BV22DRAFT_309073 [Leucogyrophana mollusca]